MFTYVSREVHHSEQRYRRCNDENPDARQSSDSRHSRHVPDASQDYTVHVSTALFATSKRMFGIGTKKETHYGCTNGEKGFHCQSFAPLFLLLLPFLHQFILTMVPKSCVAHCHDKQLS